MIELTETESKPGTIRTACLLVSLIFLLLSPSLEINANDTSRHLAECPSVEEEIVDLEILADMLARTTAVSLFTKLSLKKDINKVLARMEEYHAGQGKFSLEQLEEQYNLLLMKIAAHLQDKDLKTHRHLCNAWLVIWEDLKNPERFRDHGP